MAILIYIEEKRILYERYEERALGVGWRTGNVVPGRTEVGARGEEM